MICFVNFDCLKLLRRHQRVSKFFTSLHYDYGPYIVCSEFFPPLLVSILMPDLSSSFSGNCNILTLKNVRGGWLRRVPAASL